MAFTTANLSLYHSFSKMPAQDSTTLGNAINKSGHTVTASEVWAQDIPYYGKMGSIEDVKSKVQPYARKNDMCYITAGADKGKTFQYDGNGNWTDITATLIDGALIKNANDDVVLLYHKGQTLTNLTADNNANTDSADNAARLWAKRDTEGVTIPNSGTRLIEQFVAPTDKALNGLASVAYAPVIANGSLISGSNYYDYCFSGTILWASKRTTSTVIDCFEYVGQKVSTVVDTVTTNAAEIKSVKDQVDTISDALGLGATPGQDTLGSRVSKTESALRTMLGLGTDAEVVASQSIAKSIQDAIDALGDVAVKSDIKISDIKVKVGNGEATSLTPDSNKSVTIEIPDAPEAVVTAEGTVTTDGFTKTAAVTSLANAAINAAITGTDGAIADAIDQGISNATLTSGDNAIESATGDTATKLVTAAQVKEYVDENAKVTITAATAEDSTGITISPNGQESTSFTIGIDQTKIATKQSVDDVADAISGVSQTVASIQSQLSTGSVATGISEAKAAAQAAQAAADAKVASVTGGNSLVTVSGDKNVTITVSSEIATKTDAANAASSAITTSLAGTTAGTIGAAVADAKKAGTDAASALNTAKGQSLAQTGTLSGMFSVTTAGTVGTGITGITISDTGLSTAISNARTNAVADVKALTLSASDTDDAAKVTVALGGTVETPTITVTTSDIASAQTLATLKSTVETHISEAAGLYLSVKKVDTLPADADAKTNKIYLVPVDTEAGRAQNIHTEYIWTNGQWEIIGTTAIDINSLEASAKAAQDAADKAQGEVDAVEEAIAAMDADLTVNGISVKQVDGTITELSEALITASVPANTTSVVGNVAYVGSTKHVVAPEKFQTAATMPNTLTSWVADLSNLTNGNNMFNGCTGLTTFIGDLSSLTSGVGMFAGCTLDDESLEILAENLPEVTGSPEIHLGLLGTAAGSLSEIEEALVAQIEQKGWNATWQSASGGGSVD